jgi:hypothetical protein
MDCLHNALVGIPASVTLKQLDLDMIKRIEVPKAVPDRAGQQGVLLQHADEVIK